MSFFTLYRNTAFTLISICMVACKSVDLNSDLYQVEITTKLLTGARKDEFNTIDWELKRLFSTQNPARKCNIDVAITKKTTNSGISSTLFAVNQNIEITVNYSLSCEDGLKTSNSVTQSVDLTLQQTQTVAQYVGEKKVVNEMCSQIAKSMHNEIIIFFAINKK